jgi:uncharacterized protein YceH (UPF0502 family)
VKCGGDTALSIVAELEAAGEVLSPAVRAAMLALEVKIAVLEKELAELRARLGQHSGNSS